MKDCPHQEKEMSKHGKEEVKYTNNETEGCNLTLFTKEKKIEDEILLIEALGCAVIYTACTATVCERKWLNRTFHYCLVNLL